MARVLLIDDELNWRRQMRKIIEKMGHEVLEVGTEKQAQAILESEKAEARAFALIILDLRLEPWTEGFQGMNLLDLTDRRVQEDHSKVIIVSAYATISQFREAYGKHKVDDFIPKLAPGKEFYDEFQRAVRAAILKYDKEVHYGS